jgi:hypothetical protein
MLLQRWKQKKQYRGRSKLATLKDSDKTMVEEEGSH